VGSKYRGGNKVLSDIRALQRFSFKIPDGILAWREIGLIKTAYTMGGLSGNISIFFN